MTAVQTGAALECRSVTRTFSRGGITVAAVRDVSCVLDPGMQVALTGPSGSGKSTLLHLLAGLDTPTSGTISRAGRAVGMVFQGPSLVPALDVLENVALPLQLAGVDPDPAAERASAALTRLGIAGLASKLPEELSGGQAQRVAVARVLAEGPPLILADEPTGQLDHDTADRMLSVLLETATELGAALVVSTHDPRIATRLPWQWRIEAGRLSGAGVR